MEKGCRMRAREGKLGKKERELTESKTSPCLFTVFHRATLNGV